MKVMVDPALPDHRKVKRLARNLRVGVTGALGYLLHGWCRAMAQTPDGVLEGYSEGEVTLLFGYKGGPERFISAMTDAGFLEKTAIGYVIHEFPEHQGDIMVKRAKWRARKRKEREKKKDVTRDVTGGPASPFPPLPSPPSPSPSLPSLSKEGGREPTLDEVERLLVLRAEAAGIPNNPETLRRYLNAWRLRVGGQEVERVLMLPEAQGKTVIELQDAYFSGAKVAKKGVDAWLNETEKKAKTQ